jgi:hypothetical protein
MPRLLERKLASFTEAISAGHFTDFNYLKAR